MNKKLKKEFCDRISFHYLLHYLGRLPDTRTIWLFRERLSNIGIDKRIQTKTWKQLESYGIVIHKGVI